jgi:hypothetical protein
MKSPQLPATTYVVIGEIVRLGNRGISKAQGDSRRLGVPNVYAINGRLYYEMASGELSTSDPFLDRQRATESIRQPRPSI